MSQAMTRWHIIDQLTGAETVTTLKARQAAKIREISEALISEGVITLDAQANALGLHRSTAWTILKSSHKGSGLSAKIVKRMLAQRQLPPRVRATIYDYIREKASGQYGHSANLRRKFIRALSIAEVEQVRIGQIVKSPNCKEKSVA